MSKLDRAIKGLLEKGLITKKRGFGGTLYRFENPRNLTSKADQVAIDDESKSSQMTTPNRNRDKEIKNKQQAEEAPLERSPLASADVPAGAKPFKLLTKEKRDYVSAFNLSLENHLGACLDLNSLKQETLEALNSAQDQGIEAKELALRCSLKLNQEQQVKALNGNPIRNPIAYLVRVLPSWVDSELWTSSNQATPDYPSTGEHLPHTPGFYDPFLETEETPIRPTRPATEQERKELEALKEARKQTNIKDLLKEKGLL